MTSELYVRSGQIANFGGSASVKMNYKKKISRFYKPQILAHGNSLD